MSTEKVFKRNKKQLTKYSKGTILYSNETKARRKKLHHSGIVYAKEVPMIKVKIVKEKNGKGTPLQTVIQYWTKDGVLVAEGRVNQLDEPEINRSAS